MKSFLLAVVAATIATGCGKDAEVAKDLFDAGKEAAKAVETIRGDTVLAEAAADFYRAGKYLYAAIRTAEGDTVYFEVRDVVHIGSSVGPVGESCASRCQHECGGLDVASCILHCSTPNCHPSCCGCSSGPGCYGCGSCGEFAIPCWQCQELYGGFGPDAVKRCLQGCSNKPGDCD